MQLHPGIYPNLHHENIGPLIQHCVREYKIESGLIRVCHVTFCLRNLQEVSADTIACLSFAVFDSLYRSGYNKSSEIRLEVKRGYTLELENPLGGSLYTLKTSKAVKTYDSGISRAYAFLHPEQCTGFLCFYFDGAIDVAMLDRTLSFQFSQGNVPESSVATGISSTQRIINFIMSLNCLQRVSFR